MNPTQTLIHFKNHLVSSVSLWMLLYVAGSMGYSYLNCVVLLQANFAEDSKFRTCLSVSHTSRACGHRFRTNSAASHPVLPLLITTSHHNLPIRVGYSPVSRSPHHRLSGILAKNANTRELLGIGAHSLHSCIWYSDFPIPVVVFRNWVFPLTKNHPEIIHLFYCPVYF